MTGPFANTYNGLSRSIPKKPPMCARYLGVVKSFLKSSSVNDAFYADASRIAKS